MTAATYQYADLLGIHPKTAERWATLVGENWSEYVSSLT